MSTSRDMNWPDTVMNITLHLAPTPVPPHHGAAAPAAADDSTKAPWLRLLAAAPTHNLSTKSPVSPAITTTSTNQGHQTVSLKVFSFEFLDSKEFQDRVADILAGRRGDRLSPSGTPQTSIATTVVSSVDSNMPLAANLGLLIPVAIFALFLLFVGVCLLRHGIYKSGTAQKRKSFALSNFYRSQSGWESARASTRSTMALQSDPKSNNITNNTAGSTQRDFIPRLDRISESPEDRFLGMGMSRCDSSLESLMSQLQHDLAAMVASNRSLGISPYELIQPPNYFSEVSQSYPNLPVSAQAPFSPYHLAWMSSNVSSMGPPSVVMAKDDYSANMANTFAADGTKGSAGRTWKSPYHPPNNTPTNVGGDCTANATAADSGSHLSGVFVNQVSSLSLLPNSSRDTVKDGISASEPELQNHKAQRAMTMPQSSLAKAARSCSADPVWVTTPSTDCILSGKSNLGSWRYNNLYIPPPPPPSEAHHGNHRLFPLSSTDRYAGLDVPTAAAHNASVTALAGSGTASSVQPLDDLCRGCTSLPDLPNRVGQARLPLYQADLARYLHYEFSHYNPAPPYEACPARSAPHCSGQAATGGCDTCDTCDTVSGAINYDDDNTSTRAHMDSLEMRTTSSTMTGQTSDGASGYTAGPGHSTSLHGVSTTELQQHLPGIPVSNSSLLSNSISSIMPVNSGATHNSPNTSFADSSIHSKSVKKGSPEQDPGPEHGPGSEPRPGLGLVSGPELELGPTSTINASSDLAGNSAPDDAPASLPVAKSSASNQSTVTTSLPYDELLSSNGSRSSTSVSHAAMSTPSSGMENQSQHTTAPRSVSLQWDSFSTETTSTSSSNTGTASLGATCGAATVSMMANQGSHNASGNSTGNRPGTSVVGQRSTVKIPANERPFSGLRRGGVRATQMNLQWDSYPFYKSGMSGPGRKSPIRMEPGNTGPPPKRPLSKLPDAPGLVTQYWV